MADAKFSLGSVNITDYLIVRCRKATDPIPEITRQVFGPAPPTNINIVFVGLDAEEYFFDVYESSDGAALTLFFNTFLIDVPTNTILEEWKPYTVGGSEDADPPASTDVVNSTEIVDSYLDGKNVVAFIQRGTGPLRPTVEWTRTSTGIALVGSLFFNDADVYFAVINYRVTGSSTSNTSFPQEATITVNTTLDSSYYGKIINLNGTGTRLVVTMASVADVPDGTEFLFIDQMGGAQLQAKIVFQTTEYIVWNGANMPEIWVGKGGFLRVKKAGTKYKLVNASDDLNNVGRRFSGMYGFHPNAHPEDNSLWSADDYPRIWWWVINKLNPNTKITDDNLDAGGYVRPANRQGQFVVSITKRLFRFPMTMSLSEKGLKDFVNFGNNNDRSWVDPGGFQSGAVGRHRHTTHGFGPFHSPGNPDLYLSHASLAPYATRYSGGGADSFGALTTPDSNMQTGDTGDVNIVDNFGVIYNICI